MPGVLVASLVIAAASLAVVAPAPSYDPWAWLLWGREITELRLSTPEGPAFKPLPVAVSVLLAPLGGAAPWLWVLAARTASIAALLLSFRAGRRLAGGSVAGGLLAAVAVLVTGRFADYAASGVSEGMLLAFALAGLEAARRGRTKTAIGCATACALLRVETWPLLIAAAALTWRGQPSLRPLLTGLTLLVPVAWFVPEWLGSGDLLRSSDRARIPNPGQPALAPVPALASLSEGLRLVPWPAWAGLAALVAVTLRRQARDAHGREATGEPRSAKGGARGPLGASRRPRRKDLHWTDAVRHAAGGHPLAPAAIGLAWIAIVAAMAQAGFSGEARYALPGAALVAISGAAGLVRAARALPVPGAAAGIALVIAVVMIVPRAGHLSAIPAAQAHQWRLAQDLERAIAAVGGRDRVLACGTPYVGRLRGPLMAYALDVAKARVEPDAPPAEPGVVFRSPLRRTSEPAPHAPTAFAATARVGDWEVLEACREQAADTAN